MNFSKMLAAAVLVASLVLAAEAGGHYCRGPHCRRAPPAYLPGEPHHRGAANPHGPYHSYAVRPAVYGGPRLYSYRGYARQPAPVAAIHLKAAAYSPLSHAPLVAPLTLAIETDAHQQHHYAAPLAPAPAHGNGYAANYAPALRPIKAVLLAPVHAIVAAPLEKPTGYLPARPAYLSAHEQKRVALASQLYRDEKRRPAAYGSGHYYQTLDTLKAKNAYGRPAAAAGGAY